MRESKISRFAHQSSAEVWTHLSLRGSHVGDYSKFRCEKRTHKSEVDGLLDWKYRSTAKECGRGRPWNATSYERQRMTREYDAHWEWSACSCTIQGEIDIRDRGVYGRRVERKRFFQR